MTQKFFIDAGGAYIGAFDGPNGGYWNGSSWGAPPVGVTTVPTQPPSADSTYMNGAWVLGPSGVSQQVQMLLGSAMSAGLAVTSTGTPALDASYALDEISQQQISDIAVPLFAGAGFPGGTQTFAYPDVTGQPHSFAVTDFKNFYQAVRTYLLALNTTAAILSQGGSAEWPNPAATIA